MIIIDPMPYEVQTPVFEGPFDLLLHLILAEQVDLYEISLSTIVDGYLAELERMEELDLDVATEFLLIAATLVELKSRRLLPDGDDVDLDDELALWEERDLLLPRLLECKTFKEAAIALSVLAGDAGRSAGRTVGVDERYLGPDARPAGRRHARRPAPRLPPGHHAQAAAAHRPRPRGADPGLGHRRRRRAGRRAAPGRRITFRALTGDLVERLEVVVRFLAVLELFKQGLVDLDQPRTFGDIEIVWLGRDHDGARRPGRRRRVRRLRRAAPPAPPRASGEPRPAAPSRRSCW